MTQAERMQQLLRARAPPPPPPPPPTPTHTPNYASPPNRMRTNYASTRDNVRPPYQRQTPLPRAQYQQQREPQYQIHREPNLTRPPPRDPVNHAFARTQGESRYTPTPNYQSAPQTSGGQGIRNSRYNVTMDAQTGPAVELPAFRAGQLPLRTATSQLPNHQPRPSPPKLNQADLDELLGNNSRRPRAPLTRDANIQKTCMHCGSRVHSSFDCPDKPVLRQSAPAPLPSSDESQQTGNLTEAAQAFARQNASRVESRQGEFGNIAERRRKDTKNDGKARRFQLDDDKQMHTQNRYEEPKWRKNGGFARQNHRLMRNDFEEDEEDKYINRAERKRLRKEAKKKEQEAKGPVPVLLPQYISIANLATKLKVRLEDFIKKLEELGFEEVQSDHIMNAEHAGLVAQEYNFEPIVQPEEADEDLHPAPALSPEEYANLPARPPVVTIMGHVDHGKTTILDYMRSASVAAGEFGGITQHIGAFSVPLSSGKAITFLDTPGHAAFETMRARGANVTDIVVLVVAADDSVMPQTVEAIKHARAANVPMIVAINKIDVSQADPEAVKLDLGRHGIEVEDFGGDVQAICVSGKTGQGIPDLEEAITTLSEMLDHRADPTCNVEGWVLEGSTKKSGKVATVLVRSGTLHQGDLLVAGTTWTRVRTLRNEAGITVEEVGPGMPVEVDGWREQPIAGDEVLQATDEQQAQFVSELRMDKLEREQMAKDMDAVNESRRQQAERRAAEEAAAAAIKSGEEPVEESPKAASGPKLLSFIVKGDVSGSVEAVIDSISALGNGEVGCRVLRHGVGAPSEFDVEHAADAQGHIVNFNTAVPGHIMALAQRKGVKILDLNIIYRVVEEVKTLLEEKLPPKIVQKVTGEAEIAMTFEIGIGGRKKMMIAGSKVRNGDIKKGSKTRVLRNNVTIHDGKFPTTIGMRIGRWLC